MREVIDAAAAVTGRAVPVREAPRRPGDPAVLVADATLARRELLWTPRFPDVRDQIQHAAAWITRRGR